jgi:hypothetical protein
VGKKNKVQKRKDKKGFMSNSGDVSNGKEVLSSQNNDTRVRRNDSQIELIMPGNKIKL